jgi:5-methylcytosine-specific restriction protein B
LKAADEWKRNCLLNDSRLFSPEERWTAANVTSLAAALLNNPIHGSEKFIDKLEQQLSASTPAIQQLGAETLWLLYLFISKNQMGAAVKRERIAQIWPTSAGALPNSPLLSDETLAGIAKPGAAFMTKMPDELGYLLSAVQVFKELAKEQRQQLLSDPWRFGEWLDQQPGSDRRAFRHMLLYLCFPETYERISSQRHKQRIRGALENRLPTDERRVDDWSLLATDRVLLSIRHLLEGEYGTSDLDFYVPPLRALWADSDTGEPSEFESVTAEGRRFWIEKTIVSGRPDRESGEHAVGQALWSPHRSKNGGDIYANMRRVREGDVVFHLTDNHAFTGVSIVAATADDTFVGLAGTDWEGPAYRVQLTNYQQLDPPLPREAFLETEPFAT